MKMALGLLIEVLFIYNKSVSLFLFEVINGIKNSFRNDYFNFHFNL